MTRAPAVLAAALAAALLGAAAAQAQTLNPISRDEIVSRGASALGFSYFWGHGSWLPGHQGDSPGVCTPNPGASGCPSCSHTGRYGADCSGFVCKAWAMTASNADVTQDQHPYSTADLITPHAGLWTQVDPSAALPGDIRVYRTSTSGHTYLVRALTGAGQVTTIEAKGCNYGILSQTRSDSWVTMRRANLSAPVAPPDTPEVPAGPAGGAPGEPLDYCTRATDAAGGSLVDSVLVRQNGALVQRADAPAALAGAEMCVTIVFTRPGAYALTAQARDGAGLTSAESAALAVTIAVVSDGGSPGGADAGGADAGSDAGGGGPPDAGGADAGSSDAGHADAGHGSDGGADAGSQADAGAPPDDDGGQGDGDPVGDAGLDSGQLVLPPGGCGGCGGGGAAGLELCAGAGFLLARRRRR